MIKKNQIEKNWVSDIFFKIGRKLLLDLHLKLYWMSKPLIRH